jgi:hypothetical protein
MDTPAPSWRDPWKLAVGLVLIVSVLALLFPKPERMDVEDNNIPEHRIPPPGASEAILADPEDVRCLREGETEARPGCRLLGAEGTMAYHLFVRWDLSELIRRNLDYEVSDARLELRENHEEQYEGPIRLIAPQSNTLRTDGPALATGGRVSTRTLRAPLSEAAPDLDALIEGWISGRIPNNGLLIAVDPTASSSVDEYTPSLSFFYTVKEER